MRKFHFVDFAARFQNGFRNHVVSVTKVPELVESFGLYSCFSTYFFYSDEILTYMSTRAVDSKPTIAGYEGKVWAPYFPTDIDHSDFGVAVRAARFLVSFFLDEWKVEPNALQIYFSGSKGFHLMLDTRIFGKVTPSKSLPLIFSAMRRHLAHELPENLDQAIDLSIKDRVRLLRLPNTVHEKSNLLKILLSREELDTLDQKAIFDLAREARPLSVTDETGLLWRSNVTENAQVARFFRRIRRQVRQITKKPFEYHFRHPEDLSHLVFPCAGVQTIWQGHVDPGYRNNCAIRLASEFRLLGLSEEETRQKLFEWTEQNQIGLPDEEVGSVVRSAFQHPFPYRYGCHDEILRHFCPLESYETCQAHVARHSKKVTDTKKGTDM